jgi:hypothetical protein
LWYAVLLLLLVTPKNLCTSLLRAGSLKTIGSPKRIESRGGFLVGFAGALLCCLDPSWSRNASKVRSSYSGDGDRADFMMSNGVIELRRGNAVRDGWLMSRAIDCDFVVLLWQKRRQESFTFTVEALPQKEQHPNVSNANCLDSPSHLL